MDHGRTLRRQAERFGAPNYHPLDVVLTRGRGVWVWDMAGRRYLDCLSAYSALNHGHRHPRLVRAARAQLGRLTLTSRAFHNDELGPFLQALCRFAGMECALPMNTGAEAVETALKAARKWGETVKRLPRNRAEIVVCDHNFHGRTTTIVSFSSDAGSRDGFGPYTPGFRSVPFGDLAALERALTPRTAAFLVEPIQGEAGVRMPPEGYLRGARDLCTRAGVLFVLDEIQTGLGRTGKRFAWQHEGARPDLLIVGKALGGGLVPVSALLGPRAVLGLFTPGTHGSTFGGNPLACRIAREALAVLTEEGLIVHAARMGRRFLRGLEALAAAAPAVREVRGRGLLLAVEVRTGAAPGRGLAPTGGARSYCEALAREGLLCKETHETTIRFAPPLVITAGQVDWALARIARVLGGDA